MKILVCIKSVPDVGSKINLKNNQLEVDDKNLGYTISPHEECCVQEAVDILSEREGVSTVLTLGPKNTEEQLRNCLARGISQGVLLENNQTGWDSFQTAECISAEILKLEEKEGLFDLILFGAESADLENSQVHLRVSNSLNRPCLSRISSLEISDKQLLAKREGEEGIECYEIPLPTVLSLKDGMNLPKHPSLRGTMLAKKKKINVIPVEPKESKRKLIKFINVEQEKIQAEILGEGPSAAKKVVDLLHKLEVLS